MPSVLQQSILEAVDVSAAFDNCFFHSYSAYLIANHLPFPDDLFNFSSVLGENSPASQLQNVLAHQDPRQLFDDYLQCLPQDKKPNHPHFLVEKTLIYGVLFREWFATKLVNHELNCQAMMSDATENIQTIFLSYKEFRPSVPKEILLTSSPLLQSNVAFLEYLTFYPKAPSSELDASFEPYFYESHGDVHRAIELYWQAEGYQHYCQHLAMLHVKITPSNFMPIMNMLDQPMIIYNATGEIILSTTSTSVKPTLEMAFNPLSGHYFLLKTPHTSLLLNEYVNGYTQYKNDRETLLASETDKLTLAKSLPSLFVMAICPTGGHVPWDPFFAFLTIIQEMQQFIQQKKTTLDSTMHPMNDRLVSKNHVSQLKFSSLLQQLMKLRALLFSSDKKAFLAATRLCEGLNQASIVYFSSQQTETDYQRFKNTCFTHIENERSTLEKHVGWQQILANVVLFIVLMGVGYLAGILINKKMTGQYLFFSPNTDTKINGVIDCINHPPLIRG